MVDTGLSTKNEGINLEENVLLETRMENDGKIIKKRSDEEIFYGRLSKEGKFTNYPTTHKSRDMGYYMKTTQDEYKRVIMNKEGGVKLSKLQ